MFVRNFVFIISFFFLGQVFSQSNEYLMNLDSARYYFEVENFDSSGIFWLKCTRSEDYKRGDFYQLGRCYAMTGKQDEAITYLKKALDMGFKGRDTAYVSEDRYLTSLHQHPKWATLEKKFIANCTQTFSIDSLLLEELERRRKLDQKYRRSMHSQNWDEQLSIDSLNRIWLDSVVSKRGWLTKKIVGEQGSYDAWLLAQHADNDLDFQKRMLVLMKEKIKTHEIRLPDYAYLYDRVQINSCEEQLYGTQYSTIVNTKGEVISIEFKPIKNSAFVDKRRKYMNLSPLEHYRQFALEHYRKK